MSRVMTHSWTARSTLPSVASGVTEFSGVAEPNGDPAAAAEEEAWGEGWWWGRRCGDGGGATAPAALVATAVAAGAWSTGRRGMGAARAG